MHAWRPSGLVVEPCAPPVGLQAAGKAFGPRLSECLTPRRYCLLQKNLGPFERGGQSPFPEKHTVRTTNHHKQRRSQRSVISENCPRLTFSLRAQSLWTRRNMRVRASRMRLTCTCNVLRPGMLAKRHTPAGAVAAALGADWSCSSLSAPPSAWGCFCTSLLPALDPAHVLWPLSFHTEGHNATCLRAQQQQRSARAARGAARQDPPAFAVA